MSNNKNGYLILYACCIPVKGAVRSIICDTQRDTYKFIPNDLYDFIIACEKNKLDTVLQEYDKENQNTLESYITFLIENEFAFVTDSPELFPSINQTYTASEEINNAILDFSDISNYNIEKAISELEQLGCNSIQLRFFNNPSQTFLIKLLRLFDNTSFNTIEYLLSQTEENTRFNIENLITSERRLATVYLFNADKDEVVDYSSNVMKKIFYLTQRISGADDCGCISPTYFVPTINHITESISFNNCLNKKIAIDSSGLIKNCPSMKESYGHINNTTLKSVIKLRGFQKLWTIRKDVVDVCKDCEFRYICSDCRAFTMSDEFSKPKKCNYDPYIGKWL